MVRYPVGALILRRALWGVLTVVVIGVIVYAATTVLPGDAATAVLGHNATPARLAALRHQLGLNRPLLVRFWHWATSAVQGNFGRSLASGETVTSMCGQLLVNSAVLMAVSAVISAVLGVALGVLAALRRDGVFDTVGSVIALIASALPEFVIGIFVVVVFSVDALHWFPSVSLLPPGTYIWQEPSKLVLPALTLVIVTVPYVQRMTRAAVGEALLSDYVETAALKGCSEWRLALRHALPNALAPIIQVIGLNLLYLAGGIVLVETVFDYPGIGSALVAAVNGRDVPTLQFIVLVLAVFYVLTNILTDAAVLLATPRKRYPR